MSANSDQIHNIGRRRAWVIWAVGLSVYILAVFHRASLGVAGLLASERFGISATQLAFFTVLQLVVYAGLQVPIGAALDRFGSKKLLIYGIVLMTSGQLLFAFAASFPVAVAARAILGAGDAVVFVSVIRIVAVWFFVRQAPLVTQLTGQFGQLGSILAASPLGWALHEFGWTRTFSAASSVGVVLLVAVVLLVKDSPYASGSVVRIKLRALAQSVRTVWGNPGTRLGMWSHFTSQFSVTVFALLWGYPFLVRGQGWSPSAASMLLMAMTAWAVFSGMMLGWLVARLPFYRSWIVACMVGLIATLWTLVLARSTPAPAALLVAMAFATATGGPASMVGFDLARTFTPVQAVGRANGIVNIGGFFASLTTMALVGIVLDWREPGGMDAYDLADFRVAMSVQYLFWVFGLIQIFRYRRKALSHLDRMHPDAIAQMKAGQPFVHPGIGDREGV